MSKQRVLEEAGRDIEEQKALIAAAEAAVRNAQEEKEEVEEVLWGSLEAERAKLAHKEAELQSLLRNKDQEVESAQHEVAKMREKLGSARVTAERAELERAELARAVEKMRGREKELREKERELEEKEIGLTKRVNEMAEELRLKEEALLEAQRQVEAQRRTVSGPNRAPVLREIANVAHNNRYCDAVSETSMFSDAENVPWGDENRVNDQEEDSLKAVNAELEEANLEMEERVCEMEEELTRLRLELQEARAAVADVRTEKTYAKQDRHIAASVVSEQENAWLFWPKDMLTESTQRDEEVTSLKRELAEARKELQRLETLQTPDRVKDTPPAEFRLHRGRTRTSPDGHSVVMTDDETVCQFEGDGFQGFDVAAHEENMADQLSEVGDSCSIQCPSF